MHGAFIGNLPKSSNRETVFPGRGQAPRLNIRRQGADKKATFERAWAYKWNRLGPAFRSMNRFSGGRQANSENEAG